eukprot:Colp12_sorted_trinity150504_noHs@31771
MLSEINAAATFLSSFLTSAVTREKVDSFHAQLVNVLKGRYISHWYTTDPDRGSAYRCISCCRENFLKSRSCLDPIILEVLNKVDSLNNVDQDKLFPENFTLWIDPGFVAYRIGDNGSVCEVYSKEHPERAVPVHTVTHQANSQLGANTMAALHRHAANIRQPTPTKIRPQPKMIATH